MNKRFLIMFGILFLLSSLQFASSIGITPGRTTVNFESGLSKEVSFSVINSENKEMSVVFVVRGNLSDYITMSQTYAEFSSGESSKSFTYTINLPDRLPNPGRYETEIVALEMPKNIKEQGTFIGATVAVATQLHVYVPYPDKYAEAEVNVVEQGDGKIFFFVPVINRGDLDIVDVRGVIDIYTSLNEKVTTINTDTDDLLSMERTELVAELESDLNPGKYVAVVSVVYDNEVVEIRKEFNVGEMALEINEVSVPDFELGSIAKFNALVENKWSSDLENVYLNIIVYNEEGEVMADFKSPTYNVEPLSKIEMVSYWDTAGVKEGTYDGKIILKYGDKSSEKNIQMKITDDEIEVIGLTGRVIVRDKGGFNWNNILIILVVILILANIFWFIVIKKILKRKK